MLYSLQLKFLRDIFLEKHWRSVVSRTVCDYFLDAQRSTPNVWMNSSNRIMDLCIIMIFFTIRTFPQSYQRRTTIWSPSREAPWPSWPPASRRPSRCLSLNSCIALSIRSRITSRNARKPWSKTIPWSSTNCWTRCWTMVSRWPRRATFSKSWSSRRIFYGQSRIVWRENRSKFCFSIYAFRIILESGVLCSVSGTLPSGQLSAIPWRRSGVKYTNNEAYFDVVEEVDAIIDKNGQTVFSEIQGYVWE